MFQLSEEEFSNLIFQNGTSSWGGARKAPFAFTEQGVAMLSGVLNSETAIEVNIQIIRIFIRMRELPGLASASGGKMKGTDRYPTLFNSSHLVL